MYLNYFNLKVKPFELLPNPAFLYQSRSHKKALNFLTYGLHERAGFILLTGEVGSGKTTIVRNIIKDMESDVVLSMIFNTRASNKQILAMINEDFGLNVVGKDKITLLRNLNDFLVNIHAQKRRAVVIIDEAQNLTTSALEEIRLLSNLEATDAKLLQIVLVGQPELKKTIAQYELRQLRQRISVHSHIEALTRNETNDYVYHRLNVAGNREALQWTDEAFDVLFKYSQGIPRLINVFCDFILLAAYSENTRELSFSFVEEVVSDVAWDKHVTELDVARPGLKAFQQKNIVDRLGVYDQKLTALEGLLVHRDEINRDIRAQKEMFNEILELQENGFRRMEAGLERTCHHLQMYLTGFVAKDTQENRMSDVEALEEVEDLNNGAPKGLLGRLFS